MQSSQPAKFRIFVVDDEYVIATTLATILKRSGFDAVSFTEPLEALGSAAFEKAPDLLISDVSHAGHEGIDLAILMLTAFARVQGSPVFGAGGHCQSS
jgi:CheY-like chemotaxis protein